MLCGRVSTLKKGDKWDDGAFAIIPLGKITGKEAREYMHSDIFVWTLEVWSMWKELKVLPHGAGSNNERSITLWAIRVWEQERKECQRYQEAKYKRIT